jgi:hypothetical protein
MNVTIGVAIIGFLGYGVSLALFVHALRHLGTARTGAYFSTAPFTGAALAFALGQGRLDWAFWLAGFLMLIGVWLHVSERMNIGTFMSPWSTNTFTITTNITTTSTRRATLQGNRIPIATDTHGWRIPTHITPTSIIAISTERGERSVGVALTNAYS